MRLTPSQLRVLLRLYVEEEGGDPDQWPRPDGRYADAAYRRLIQRGLVSEGGLLTPMGLQEAERFRGRR